MCDPLALIVVKLATVFLALASTTQAFHLIAQECTPKDGDKDTSRPPLYLTRYCFLTANIEDSDNFVVAEREQLFTFPEQARSHPIGIFNSTSSKYGFASLTVLEAKREKKVGSSSPARTAPYREMISIDHKIVLNVRRDGGEILVIENDDLPAGDEAIYLARKPPKDAKGRKGYEDLNVDRKRKSLKGDKTAKLGDDNKDF
ncbi:hypothetical protein BJ878DRAFT_544299 [Calycina marina]|uniref:Uncharacterized protein n=1 Tax=Calycina marina TaxID=1763456 RepID=A0A9P8CEK0_9HELO|nr:hypothetical protein BJ878DRAFT_544299 [Calycina marina]